MKSLTRQAIKYLKLGLSVFPVKLFYKPGNPKLQKMPLVKWQLFQAKYPTEDEVHDWFSKFPDANLGIVTGAISNLFVLDLDIGHDPNDLIPLKLPPTRMAKTPSGGIHMYYQHPRIHAIKTQTDLLHEHSKIDVRGDGGMVVLPPSENYEWIDDSPMAEASPELLEAVRNDAIKPSRIPNILGGVEEGSRNDSTASFAGKLLQVIPKESNWPFAFQLLQIWNEQNVPELDINELRTVFESVAKKEKARKDFEKQEKEAKAKAAFEKRLKKHQQQTND